MDEITAEYEVAQLVQTRPLEILLTVSVGAKTDMGRVRENNEDKFEFFIPESETELANRGMVFVVCDGMGGHEAGQIASELATKTFIDVYRNHPSEDPDIACRAGILAANRYVVDVARAIPSRRGMGTTLSALLLVQDRALVGQVGDSRVYRLRNGDLTQVTTDHTWVEDMVKLGTPREEAERHQNRHMITRAIGAEGEVVPDLFDLDLAEGDVFLVCSDGVTNHVMDDSIRRILSETGPSEAAWRLVSEALAGGGSDNATAIVVRIDAMRSNGESLTQVK